ncbi:MAG: cytidine deaminase [Trueperaceae bacterium]|nr:cytidine deaminase [Trueperaceae bacterium]
MTTDRSSPPPTDLAEAAWRSHGNAYVPYSGFPVGAALRTDRGEVFAGANIENASYGLGRCAEQSAVQAMASAGGRTIEEIVVVSSADVPASPCGACRQVLFEFGADARVWLVNEAGVWRATSVRELLPDAFELPKPDERPGDGGSP